MRQIMVVLAVAVLVSACGQSPVAPIGQTDFAISNPDQPVNAAAKPIGKPVANSSGDYLLLRGASVFAVITKNGVPFFSDPYMSLRFSRSISGRARSYDWGSGIGTDSIARFQIVTEEDPSGMYCAQLKGGSGKVVGEWASIPVNERKSINTFILPIGEQARIVSNDEFDDFTRPFQVQLQVSVLMYPTPGDVVAGKVGHTFTNFVFDATAASEDIVVSKVRSQLTINIPGTAADMSNGQMFDGLTALNVGPLIINPSAGMGSGDEIEFKMGLALTIPKGTVKTVSMRFNMSANPVGTDGVSIYAWGLKDSPETVVAYGATSGKRVLVRVIPSGGQPWMLRSKGVFKIGYAPDTPSSFSVEGGSLNVPVLRLKFFTLYESISLSQIGFKIVGNSKAVTKLTVYGEYGNKLGEGIFATGDYAMVTLPLRLQVNQGGSRTITVSADFSPIGLAYPAKSGDKVQIGWFSSGGDDGTWGIGESSGTKIYMGSSLITFVGGTITLK